MEFLELLAPKLSIFMGILQFPLKVFVNLISLGPHPLSGAS